MIRGFLYNQETRRGSWRAEIGEAWVGKGSAHHFKCFAVLGRRNNNVFVALDVMQSVFCCY